MHDCDTYFTAWPQFLTRTICFRWTTYDNINGPGGTIYVIIFGPAGLLMYPDQIFRYRPWRANVFVSIRHYCQPSSANSVATSHSKANNNVLIGAKTDSNYLDHKTINYKTK